MNSRLFKIRQRIEGWLFHSNTIALGSFIFSLGITFLLWWNAREEAMENARSRFKASAAALTQSIEDRMFAYENFLHTATALLNTVEHMNRKKWQTYVESTNLANSYPGFQGIGYSKVIPPDELSGHIREMRAEGFSDYKLVPEGKRSEYHAIIYLEPLDVRNRRAIGYDMFSNPVRQEAMIRARDTAKAAISGKVTLVQENDSHVQAGFLMYLPFYHTIRHLQSQSQRRARLEGFVYAPFRTGDLMNEIFTQKNPDIALRLYDGPSTTPENLLYQSSPPLSSKALFEENISMVMYGRTWSAHFQSLPSFERTIDQKPSWLILFAGFPISFLLSLTILSFSRTTKKAQAMARTMTAKISALNEELEMIISAVPSPIILHTEDGTIVKLNQAWSDITEYTQEEISTIDILIKTLYPDMTQQLKVKQHIQSLYSIVGKVDEGEFTFPSKSGRKMTWQFSSAPFGLIKGKRAVITSAMDITEIKNRDELMIMQSRLAAMGEMINMIAHQWRQPLSSISTIAGTLSIDVIMDEYNKELFENRLNAISNLAMELSETINDFRSFFKEKKVRQQTTWKELIEASMLIMEPVLKSKNIALHITYDEDITFMTYSREIKQVILNLLKNSEDALIENAVVKPAIWLRTSIHNEKTSLEIEDNGGGIATEIIDKIFDPYFSTKMDKDGTGIGLYMSKMIVEQHAKGKLKVYNTEKGASFKILLPLLHQEGESNKPITHTRSARQANDYQI